MNPILMRELRSDRGTTMPEVMVVLAISALLAVPLFAILRTTTRIEQSQSTVIDARAELDWALTLLVADIHAGTPTARPLVGPRMTSTLPLSIVNDSGVEELIHWRIGRDGLERIVYNASTEREQAQSIVVAAISGDGLNPPFSYFDANGKELDPASVSAQTIADCTTLVRITLAAPTAETTVSASRDAAIRSRSPGGNGC